MWGLLWLCLIELSHGLNYRPIIGIYAQPSTYKGEYIAASYVKWIESAGGRVVPIPYNAPYNELDAIFDQINGVLFPGGDATINDKVIYLYNLAVHANQQGDVFPMWGTCLGMEWMLQMTSNDLGILDQGLDAMNITLPLNFTSAVKTSRLFQDAPTETMKTLATRAVTMNNHNHGILPQDFYKHPILSDFYTVLATNTDRKDVPFVAVIEGKNMPFWATQYHPEKNMFEWGTYPDGVPYEVIDHELDGIKASQYLANFFVRQARRNNHRFKNATLERYALIYNYHAYMFTWPGFVESYLFQPHHYTSFLTIE